MLSFHKFTQINCQQSWSGWGDALPESLSKHGVCIGLLTDLSLDTPLSPSLIPSRQLSRHDARSRMMSGF